MQAQRTSEGREGTQTDHRHLRWYGTTGIGAGITRGRSKPIPNLCRKVRISYDTYEHGNPLSSLAIIQLNDVDVPPKRDVIPYRP